MFRKRSASMTNMRILKMLPVKTKSIFKNILTMKSMLIIESKFMWLLLNYLNLNWMKMQINCWWGPGQLSMWMRMIISWGEEYHVNCHLEFLIKYVASKENKQLDGNLSMQKPPAVSLVGWYLVVDPGGWGSIPQYCWSNLCVMAWIQAWPDLADGYQGMTSLVTQSL